MWRAIVSPRFRYTMLPKKDHSVTETVEDTTQDEDQPSVVNVWARRDR